MTQDQSTNPKPILFYRGSAFKNRVTKTKSGEVHFVDAITHADIDYRKFTANYREGASRPYFVLESRIRYRTLEAAAAAVVKLRNKLAQQA